MREAKPLFQSTRGRNAQQLLICPHCPPVFSVMSHSQGDESFPRTVQYGCHSHHSLHARAIQVVSLARAAPLLRCRK